jgi:hypothetical protein
MCTGEPSAPCYLVEWYRAALIGEQLDRATSTIEAAAASMTGSPVCLLAIVVVPTDEVIFGVFAADSEADVNETCRLAGMTAQRVTAAVGLGGAAKHVTQ